VFISNLSGFFEQRSAVGGRIEENFSPRKQPGKLFNVISTKLAIIGEKVDPGFADFVCLMSREFSSFEKRLPA